MKLILDDTCRKTGDDVFVDIEIDLPNIDILRSYFKDEFIMECINAGEVSVGSDELSGAFFNFAKKHDNKICNKEDVLSWIKIFEACIEQEYDDGYIKIDNHVDVWSFKDGDHEFNVVEFTVSGNGDAVRTNFCSPTRIIYKEEIKTV